MKINEIRQRNTHQNKEASKDVDDGLPPSKTPLNLPQFVRKENNEEGQGDQYERKDDEVEKVKFHHPRSRKADPGLMASVFHTIRNKVKIKIFRLWVPSLRPRHSKSDRNQRVW